jgi:hypothetical protein
MQMRVSHGNHGSHGRNANAGLSRKTRVTGKKCKCKALAENADLAEEMQMQVSRGKRGSRRGNANARVDADSAGKYQMGGEDLRDG